MTRRTAWLAGLAILLASCGGAPALDVREIGAEVADVPPADARLVEADWPQTAAWIAREAEAGRPVVMNLFGSWCEPCKAEAPLLRAAVDAHPEITFLFIDTRDRIASGRAFLEDEGLDDQPSLFDPDSLVYAGIGARGMPTTAFFSADGSLVDIVHGILTEATLAQRLADLAATIDR